MFSSLFSKLSTYLGIVLEWYMLFWGSKLAGLTLSVPLFCKFIDCFQIHPLWNTGVALFSPQKATLIFVKIPTNSNWPCLFNILLKINYLPLFSLRTSLRCIEGVFEAPSTKLYKRYQYFSYSFLLINCVNHFRYNPEAVFSKLPGAIKPTARSLGLS